MVQIVILSANGEARTMKTTAVTGIPTGAAVAKALRKTKPAEVIGSYTWNAMTLTIWGWREGKAGTENKHELPPPHDEILLFGDAVIATANGADITVEQWKVFYDLAFGGFEDTKSQGDEKEEEEEDADEEDEEESEAEAEVEAEADEEADEVDEEDASEDDEDVDEEDEGDDDCYEEGDDGGGGSKRRAPRRRTATAPEYRRIEMGLRSRIKIPTPIGKRAPRWQTAAELEPETY